MNYKITPRFSVRRPHLRPALAIALLLLLLLDRAVVAQRLGSDDPRSIRANESAARKSMSARSKQTPKRAPARGLPEATNGPSTWLGGVGNWNNGALWSPSGSPNAADADVSLDGGNVTNSAVSLTGAFTVGRLTIDSGDSLAITDNSTLALATGAFAGSGTIVNNGNIALNSGGNLTDLRFDGASVAFNGTGTITMNGNGANRIFGGTLTIGAGQTIRGGGSLGINLTTMINNGTVLANNGTLNVDPGAGGGFTNNSVMRASGGTLQLNGAGNGTFFNTGTIEALAGSQVQLINGAIVSGGTLSTTGTGTIRGISGTLANLTNSGAFVIADNTNTTLVGTITNNGSIALNSGGNLTDLIIDSAGATLSGTGTVTLNGAAPNRIYGGQLTIGTSQTIQGGGSLGINLTKMINNGTVLANDGTLNVDPDSAGGFTNNNVLRASGGTLQLNGNGNGTFFNTATIDALNGSQVQLINGAVVSGGNFNTTGTGTINGISATLQNLTNSGTFAINDQSNTTLFGTITNNGNIALNSLGNNTDLVIDAAGVALNGSGTVTLAGGAANRIYGGPLTIGASQTIQGGGSLGINLTTIINNGLIVATAGKTLTLDPDAGGGLTNNNRIRATGGGTLVLSGSGNGTFTNSATGVIEALAGSEVQLISGANVTGGTLSTVGDGVVRVNASQDVSISNLTNAGAFIVSDNAFLRTSGTITNNGTLTLGSLGNVSDIALDADTTFAGTGSVLMTGTFNARVRANVVGARLTIASGQTFSGRGQIGFNNMALTNQGLINANIAGQVLEIDAINAANGFLNQTTMQASNGGVLRITGNGAGTVTNTGGTIQAVGANSEVQLTSGAAITGGTLTTSTGGVIRVNGGTEASISGLTNAGTFIVNDNSFLHVAGTIVNSGSLRLNSGGNGTDILVDADTTFSGAGTVTLAGSFNSRVRAGVGGTLLTIASGQTFAGRGQIGFNDLRLINQGLIDANVASQVLEIDAVNVANGFLNQATMQASGGGVLRFTGNGAGTVTNTGGTIQATGAGSEVQLTTNATLTGGTLTTASGGVVRLNSSTEAFISDLTNAGTFQVNDNSFLHVSGTITNNGSFSLNSAGNGTDILLGGDTTFAGTGTVTLAGSNNARVRSGVGTPRLTNGAGHTFDGRGQIGFNDSAITNNGIINASVSGQTLTLDPANVTDAFLNGATGIARASNGGTLSLTGNGGGSFTNNGIFEALNASSVVMDASAVLINNIGGVLTGGSYRAFASGGGATLTIRGANITEIDTGTVVILSGAGSVFRVDTTTLETTLTTLDGALRVLANRNYTNTNALTDNGVLELGGGTFNAPSLTISSSGELFGFGTVALRPANSGLVRAVGGTLALTSGVGSAGTAQSDAASILDLSGSSTASSANFLFNNGSLALGSQNIVVALDYNNANFGVGNSFNPRGNVTGAGLINAAGNVGQTLSGTGVINGASATVAMNFGNIHVGDAPTRNYQINNTGTTGPSLRGALQTLVNGGNITDGRLTGAGVTAANFGSLALGGNTGTLGVTFNATSAGALLLQQLHIINNFDNVADQNLTITGAAFRYANPTAHTPEPVAFGNFHVGDPTPANRVISLTNNVPADGFSEALDAIIGSATGGVLTNGAFTALAPGATNNTSLSVGISTATAGSQNGTATISLQSNGSGSSGLGVSPLPSQTVNVTGAVYRLAAPTVHTPEPVAFGVRHIGDSVPGVFLSLTNNVPADGFSESLNATLGGASAGITTSGSVTGLAPAATSNNVLSVGINTATAGPRNGTATITMQSNGAGSSGLGLTNLPSQTVNVTGQVNYFADPVFTLQSGTGSVTMNSASLFTLNLGQFAQNSGTFNATLALQNFLHDATFQDLLGGTFDVSTVNDFLVTGFNAFSNLAAGGATNPSVAFNSAMPLGNYFDTITLKSTSTNASGATNIPSIQLNIQAQIVPEPSIWMLTLAGVGLLVALQRIRIRRGV